MSDGPLPGNQDEILERLTLTESAAVEAADFGAAFDAILAGIPILIGQGQVQKAMVRWKRAEQTLSRLDREDRPRAGRLAAAAAHVAVVQGWYAEASAQLALAVELLGPQHCEEDPDIRCLKALVAAAGGEIERALLLAESVRSDLARYPGILNACQAAALGAGLLADVERYGGLVLAEPSASSAQRVGALLNRGVVRSMAGDQAAAQSAYAAVLNLDGVPLPLTQRARCNLIDLKLVDDTARLTPEERDFLFSPAALDVNGPASITLGMRAKCLVRDERFEEALVILK